MTIRYPAMLHLDGGAYSITFPDLEGCQSFGDTADEALENTSEALAAFCLALLGNREKLPVPSRISSIDKSECDAIVIVGANLTDQTKSVKKTLTIPAWLNTMAEKAGINFSAVLQEALAQQLHLN